MTQTALQINELLDMLPEQEQSLAYELIKRMVLAWDPDFTKVTPAEAAAIRRGSEQIERGEFVRFNSAEEMAAYFGVSL